MVKKADAMLHLILFSFGCVMVPASYATPAEISCFSVKSLFECKALCPNCLDYKCSYPSRNCVTCAAGYQPPKCIEKCPDRKFGANCEDSCAEGCLSIDGTRYCDHVNGTCLNGCAPGYVHPECRIQCYTGRYGPKCAYQCSTHCKEGANSCDAATGACPGGCKDGYMSPTCHPICPIGFYGAGCENVCGICRFDICNHETGKCPYGCAVAGYMPDLCKAPCPRSRYGINCKKTCSPGCLKCHPTSGKCISCPWSTYGERCEKMCSTDCMGGGCDVMSGDCYACVPGWKPPTCQERIE